MTMRAVAGHQLVDVGGWYRPRVTSAPLSHPRTLELQILIQQLFWHPGDPPYMPRTGCQGPPNGSGKASNNPRDSRDCPAGSPRRERHTHAQTQVVEGTLQPCINFDCRSSSFLHSPHLTPHVSSNGRGVTRAQGILRSPPRRGNTLPQGPGGPCSQGQGAPWVARSPAPSLP